MIIHATPDPGAVLVRCRDATGDWTVGAYNADWSETLIATGLTDDESMRMLSAHNDRLFAEQPGPIQD
jgi:hypothetical protein